MHALLALRALVWTVLVTFFLASIPHVDIVLSYAARLLVATDASAAEAEAPQVPYLVGPQSPSHGAAWQDQAWHASTAPQVTPPPDANTTPQPKPAPAPAPQKDEAATEENAVPSVQPSTMTGEAGEIIAATVPGMAPVVPQSSLFSGAAVMGVPIEVPPGRNKMAPSIALTYNSYQNNGPIGVGWGVEMGAIQRSTRHGLDYTATGNGAFVAAINGSTSDLVRRSDWDQYCQSGQGYGSKIEGLNTRYCKIGNTWVVTTKDGMTYKYGTTEDFRQEVTVDLTTSTFKWCLERVQDTNGNYMTVTYTKDLGEIYLAQIRYTGNINNTNLSPGTNYVDFTYDTTTRTDKILSWTTHFAVTTAWRLTKIETSTTVNSTKTLVKRYALDYGTDTNSNPIYSAGSFRSLLRSVTVTGFKGGESGSSASLPPTTFTWQTGGTVGNYSTSWSQGTVELVNPRVFPGDANGDGRTDYMMAGMVEDSEENGGGWLLEFGVYLSNGNGTYTYNATTLSTPYGSRWFGGDVNGDGLTDFMGLEQCGGEGNWHACMRTAITHVDPNTHVVSFTIGDPMDQGFAWPPDYIIGPPQMFWFSGDANGDGKADFMGAYHIGPTSNPYIPYDHVLLYTGISAGDGTFTWTGVNSTMGWTYGAQIFPGDVNGDGKTDFMYAAHLGPTTAYNYDHVYLHTALSNGDATYTIAGYESSMGWTGYWSEVAEDVWDWVYGPQLFAGDANGDGLTDFLFATKGEDDQHTIIETAFSDGTGNSFDVRGETAPFAWTTDPIGPAGYFNGRLFSGDVNGDGKADIMYVASIGIPAGARLYTGVSKGDGTYTYVGQGTAREMPGAWFPGDTDGDGRTDFMQAVFHGSLSYLARLDPDLSLSSLDLITVVNPPLGGGTTITYAPSSVWQNTLLPMVLQTVSSINTYDGMNPAPITTTYTYAGGLFDLAEREFRGFATATGYLMRDTQNWESTTQTTFLQDAVKKGQIAGQLTTSKEGHTKQTVNTWDTIEVVGTGCQQTGTVCFPRLTQTVVTTTDAGYAAYVAQTNYEYDTTTFNVTHEYKHGQTSADDVHTWYTYAATGQLPGKWILAKPGSVTVKDYSSAILSAKWMDYDDNGNLTTEEVCRHSLPVGTSCNDENRGAASNPIAHYTPCSDGTGNVCTIQDPMGYLTTLAYDATKTYVSTKTSCTDSSDPCTTSTTGALTTTTVYDPGIGKVTSMIPPHLYQASGNPEFTSVYDPLGRITHQYRPDGGYTHYSYVNIGTPDTQYVQKQEHIEGGSVTLEPFINTYFDGTGRTYKTESTSPSENVYIVTNTDFDAAGRPSKKWSPYFSTSTPLYYTEYVYDGFSRITTITKPDASTINTQYQGLTKRIQNERGYWTSYLYDIFGRLKKVTDAQQTHAETDYAYSPVGNLTMVTAASNLDLINYTYMTYDSTGKKITMTDPDMGAWSYVYDQSGNLTCQCDAKQQVIAFTYDGLNRVKTKRSYDQQTNSGVTCGNYDTHNPAYTPVKTVTNTYDTPDSSYTGNTQYARGMLTKVHTSDGNDDVVLDLDIMQRITRSRKQVGSAAAVTMAKTYDTAGRTVTLTYFPGESGSTRAERVYRYTYNAAGNLISLHDDTNSRDIAVFSSFTVFGQYQTATYQKSTTVSVVSYYTYDPATGRIATLLSQKEVQGSAPTIYQNLAYLFDGRGNLLTKTDTLANLTHTYGYDELDRLTSVAGSGAFTYSQTYAYDAIGNITCKSDVGSYAYGSKPHAVTSVTGFTGGKNYTLTYDDNGNLHTRAVTGEDTLTVNYDADNKPTGMTKGALTVSYTYDGNGRRVTKTGTSITTYYGEAYEERDTGGVGVIHLFAGSQRVVSIRSSSQGNHEQYYLSDHLGSASVVTDENGDVKEKIEYFPFGAYRERSDYAADFPDVNYTFTGQEEDDEIGLYNYGARLYDPLLGRFISPDSVVPDPGDLQALNRYSYAMNNPVKYVDPSGHFILEAAIIGAIIGALFAGISSHWNPQAMAIGAFIGGVSGGIGAEAGGAAAKGITAIIEAANEFCYAATPALAQFGGMVAGGAAAGATAGGLNAAIYGGNIGQGMLTGAAYGAATGALVYGAASLYGWATTPTAQAATGQASSQEMNVRLASSLQTDQGSGQSTVTVNSWHLSYAKVFGIAGKAGDTTIDATMTQCVYTAGYETRSYDALGNEIYGYKEFSSDFLHGGRWRPYQPEIQAYFFHTDYFCPFVPAGESLKYMPGKGPVFGLFPNGWPTRNAPKSVGWPF